ncbi:hypothetical protein PAXRUDRAFT_831229 [Paxillus rubicundulus Ve08.2h10]|uniref:Uncharacterized protein n=1 Tax=Paxillus rubicundulus Ve08.2h10 TaxID=930991 RepID=A0A0D0E2F5_9AGAM|nr:hypothetical protein PAXRUDRAFT_831229 [Paxillus rubicundulus Ve08.2h10]
MDSESMREVYIPDDGGICAKITGPHWFWHSLLVLVDESHNFTTPCASCNDSITAI